MTRKRDRAAVGHLVCGAASVLCAWSVVAAQTPIAGSVSPTLAPALLEMSVGEPCSVRGQLLDPAGTPVAGASVWYVPDGPTLGEMGRPIDINEFVRVDDELRRRLPHVVSNGQGRFEIAGRVEPHRDPDCYYVEPDALLVIDDSRFALRGVLLLGLSHGGDVDLGEIQMKPGAVVHGRCVDDAGQPLAGVSLFPWPTAADPGDHDAVACWLECKTDADGRFEIHEVMARPFDLQVGAMGYGPMRLEGLQPALDEPLDLGDLVLVPGKRLVGRVSDSVGAPIAGARISIADRPDHGGADPDGIDDIMEVLQDSHVGPITQVATSDLDGRFATPGMPDDRYCVYVAADGFEPTRLRSCSVGGSPLDVTLQAEAVLDVHVTAGEKGQAVEGTAVSAWRYSSQDVPGFSADLVVTRSGVGVHRVHTLGRTPTEIAVSAPGFASTVVTVGGQAVSTTGSLDVALVPEATLSGRVVDEAGQPVVGVEVFAMSRDVDEGSPGMPRTTTDSQGAWQLRGLPAAKWNLMTHQPGASYGSDTTYYTAISLAAGASVAVDLPVVRNVIISGTLRDQDGEPLAGHELAIGSEPGDGQSVRTDHLGRFRFIGNGLGGVIADRTFVGGRMAAPLKSRDVQGPNGIERELTLVTGARLRGIVSPIALAAASTRVIAWDPQLGSDGRGFHETTVAADGTWTLSLPTSEWHVAAFGGGDSPALSAMVDVVIRADGSVSTGDARIELKLGGATWTVQLAPSDPGVLLVHSTRVQVLPSTWREAPEWALDRRPLAIARAEDGQFSFSGPPGDYVLRAFDTQLADTRLSVSASELGAPTPPRIVVEALGDVQGRLIQPDGSVPRATLTLRGEDGDVRCRVRRQRGGVFRLEGLMPGTYELLATAQRPAPLAGTFTVESSVEVHANETHFLDVLLVE